MTNFEEQQEKFIQETKKYDSAREKYLKFKEACALNTLGKALQNNNSSSHNGYPRNYLKLSNESTVDLMATEEDLEKVNEKIQPIYSLSFNQIE